MKKAGCMSCGGGMGKKKMAKGGTTGIVGMPGYTNNPRTEQGRILKNGGTASLPVCRGGLVRMPDGSCGKRPTAFKKGGSVSKSKGKFDLNGDGKTTFKDVLIGRGAIKKKMGGTTKRK